MIKFSDSQLLANTKFQTYKGRSILTVTTLSIGIIALSTIIIALTGVYDVVKVAFKDHLQGKYLVKADYNCFDPHDSGSCPKFDKEKFLGRFKNYNIQTIYENKAIGEPNGYAFSLEGVKVDTQKDDSLSVLGLNTINPAFIQDNIKDAEAFSKDQGGAIPIIVPEAILEPKLSANKTLVLKEKDYYNLHKATLDKYLGKKYYLTKAKIEYSTDPHGSSSINYEKLKYEKTSTEVIIVGLTTSKSSLFTFGEIYSGNLYIPDWSIEKDASLKELFKSIPIKSLYLQLDSKDKRDRFVENYYMTAQTNDPVSDQYFLNFFVSPVQSIYEQINSILNVFRNVGIGISIFFIIVVSLFIFTTVSKITSDGRKEIAIFRSYGAEKTDIRKIFNTYILLLTNIGFIIGLVIGIVITVILSLYWGEQAFYSIVTNGSNFNVDKPMFLFLGQAYIPIALLYAGTALVSILAGIIPVLRASNIQPIVALRDE